MVGSWVQGHITTGGQENKTPSRRTGSQLHKHSSRRRRLESPVEPGNLILTCDISDTGDWLCLGNTG